MPVFLHLAAAVFICMVMAACHWTQSAENDNERDETSINLPCIVVGIVRVSVRQKDEVADREACHCPGMFCGDAGSSVTNLRYRNILHVTGGSHTGVAKHSGLWDGCDAVWLG